MTTLDLVQIWRSKEQPGMYYVVSPWKRSYIESLFKVTRYFASVEEAKKFAEGRIKSTGRAIPLLWTDEKIQERPELAATACRWYRKSQRIPYVV